MNIVDIFIILIALPMLISTGHSFIYHAINTFFVLGGYMLGFYIVVINVGNMHSASAIGNALLDWTIGLALLGRIIIFVIRLIIKQINKKHETQIDSANGRIANQPIPQSKAIYKTARISDELHMEMYMKPVDKDLKNRRQKLIKSLTAMPYKLAIVALAVFLLSQTLIYTPILWVQFSTQGSGLILAATRFFPDTEISRAAKNLYPHEFESIELLYDPGPIKSTLKAEDANFKNAVDKVSPSVVRIAISQCGGTRFGSASGVVIAPNLVMTNEHVATGASEIFIIDHNGTYPASVIVIDNDHDIAIIYSKYINLEPVPMSNKPFLSDEYAMTMGYPGGSADLKMAIGKTSATKFASIQNKLDSTSSFQLSSGLGPGSSGGPVINSKGEIIGVNSGGNGELLLAVKSETATKTINAAKSTLLPTINIGCQYQRASY